MSTVLHMIQNPPLTVHLHHPFSLPLQYESQVSTTFIYITDACLLVFTTQYVYNITPWRRQVSICRAQQTKHCTRVRRREFASFSWGCFCIISKGLHWFSVPLNQYVWNAGPNINLGRGTSAISYPSIPRSVTPCRYAEIPPGIFNTISPPLQDINTHMFCNTNCNVS